MTAIAEGQGLLTEKKQVGLDEIIMGLSFFLVRSKIRIRHLNSSVFDNHA